VLCCAVLCCAVLCCAVLCCAVLYVLLQELDDKYGFLSSDLQWVTHIDNERKVRGLWAAVCCCGQQGAGGGSLHQSAAVAATEVCDFMTDASTIRTYTCL
jgi:hypothetical protein